MRLSIWQQFSSNHSANYSVVGVFESPEAAQVAHEKLKQIVTEIFDWNVNHKAQLRELSEKLTPVEKKYAQEYGIDWQEPIDWLLRELNIIEFLKRNPAERIYLFQNIVIVDAPGSFTWQTGHQFYDLIKSMKGTPHSNVYQGYLPDGNTMVFKNVEFDIRCTAPNSDVARHIYEEVNKYLTPSDPIVYWRPNPWITFHPDFARITNNMSLQKFVIEQRIFDKEHEKWWLYLQQHNPTDEERNTLYKEFFKQENRISSVIGWLQSDTSFNKGNVSQNGIMIVLEKVSASSAFGISLTAMLGWMQSLGCETKYQLREEEHLHKP